MKRIYLSALSLLAVSSALHLTAMEQVQAILGKMNGIFYDGTERGYSKYHVYAATGEKLHAIMHCTTKKVTFNLENGSGQKIEALHSAMSAAECNKLYEFISDKWSKANEEHIGEEDRMCMADFEEVEPQQMPQDYVSRFALLEQRLFANSGQNVTEPMRYNYDQDSRGLETGKPDQQLKYDPINDISYMSKEPQEEKESTVDDAEGKQPRQIKQPVVGEIDEPEYDAEDDVYTRRHDRSWGDTLLE